MTATLTNQSIKVYIGTQLYKTITPNPVILISIQPDQASADFLISKLLSDANSLSFQQSK